MICRRCNDSWYFDIETHSIFFAFDERSEQVPSSATTAETWTYSPNIDDYVGAAGRQQTGKSNLFMANEALLSEKADSSDPPGSLQDFDSIHKRVIIFGGFFLFLSSLHPRPFIRFLESLPSRRASWLDSSLHLPNGGDIRTPKKLHLLSSMFEEAGVSIGSHALSLCPAPPLLPNSPNGAVSHAGLDRARIQNRNFRFSVNLPFAWNINWQNSLTFPPHRKARHEPCRQHVLMYIHIVPKELQ